ncbi:hypothetical protein BVC93_13145 [Mycobacterium sp. MS1601]|uniref:TNT domain-containing protein n=1 Tax=Mycobacterium sp. MS1601 TaxID=1936029 RepID=UPI0009795EDA|nr:TNT domain-containing protein [Mycobacterium sp. MS1601]AQA03207.1 hypothetical protein BVC93_13145 [Mycobacterium sp. MS1601]
MSAALYIGRTGALAAALGMGAVIAVSPAAAYADDTSSPESSASSNSTGSNTSETSETSESSKETTKAQDEAQHKTQDKVESVEDEEPEADDAKAEDAPEDEPEPESEAIDEGEPKAEAEVETEPETKAEPAAKRSPKNGSPRAAQAAERVSTWQTFTGTPANAVPRAVLATPDLGSFVAYFISDGTATRPNAGVWIGNGFSYTAATCNQGLECTGGNGGSLFGNGGNGFNGGSGGRAGMVGDGGDGGAGLSGINAGNGGNGGRAGLIGDGGSGGASDRYTAAAVGGTGGRGGLLVGNGGNGGQSSTGADGADGGNGGYFFGDGGRGGTGGPGTVLCDNAEQICSIHSFGGAGGSGGQGGLFGGADGATGAAPLPVTSPLFVGYDPKWFTGVYDWGGAPGDLYPNESNPNKPYAIPGTVVPHVTLPAGTELSRFGYTTGGYLSGPDAHIAQLSLTPSSAVLPHFEYVVADPTKLPLGWSIEQSQVAPWFGQPGGGMQYRILMPNGNNGTVQGLLDSGYLAVK